MLLLVTALSQKTAVEDAVGLHASTTTLRILCFTRLGVETGISLKLGREGILIFGLPHK